MPFPVFARRLILLGAAVLYLLTMSVGSDTWWSLRAGKDMWHSHQPLLTETYSYTANGAAWPNHEWLWQVLTYGLYAVGGLALITGLNVLLAVAALAFARSPGPITRADAYLLIPAAALLRMNMEVRPQIATLFLVSLTVWLLVRERYLVTVPVLLLWANLHGAVVLGVMAVGAAFGAAFLHAVVAARQGRADWSRTRRTGLALVLGTAATLATPLGTGLWTYIPDSVARSKHNRIMEWQSAFHVQPETVTFWVMLVAIAAIAWFRRRRLWSWPTTFLLLVTAAYAFEAFSAIRTIPVFALTAVPLCASLLRPAGDRPPEPVRRANVVLVTAALATAAVATAMFLRPPATHGWTPITARAIAAVERCPGHTYTTFNDGGTLIWWAPRVPVFVDNRQDPYPDRILSLGYLGSPKRATDYAGTFRRYDIRCAAIGPDESVPRQFLEKQGWHVAYEDGTWTVMTAPDSRLTPVTASG